jgi:hypothetical protein
MARLGGSDGGLGRLERLFLHAMKPRLFLLGMVWVTLVTILGTRHTGSLSVMAAIVPAMKAQWMNRAGIHVNTLNAQYENEQYETLFNPFLVGNQRPGAACLHAAHIKGRRREPHRFAGFDKSYQRETRNGTHYRVAATKRTVCLEVHSYQWRRFGQGQHCGWCD